MPLKMVFVSKPKMKICVRNVAWQEEIPKSHLQEVLIAHPLTIPLFPKFYPFLSQVFNINWLFSTKFLVLGIYNGSLITSKF